MLKQIKYCDPCIFCDVTDHQMVLNNSSWDNEYDDPSLLC